MPYAGARIIHEKSAFAIEDARFAGQAHANHDGPSLFGRYGDGQIVENRAAQEPSLNP